MGAVCCRPTPVDFDGDVSLFHFVLLRCVGKGAFGKVRVVQHKQTRDLYALKYINKTKCVKMKAVANVIQERRLLEEVDHPFIVNLRYAFQDDENCFFVLDLMLGGDLRFHLERLGSLQEDVVKFYIAQLSSAVEFLHQIGIMHRDIKPDNILLDERGNAHLTDFNIAVHFSERKLTGVAGSMAYMAPEILTKRGYTCHIDWWSLGVCAYELIFGRRPFRGRTNSALTTSISKDPLKWPEDAEKKCSRPGMLVIKGLLDRDPTRRLGCKPNGEGFQELQRYAWLQTIDWDTLESKEQTPPFIPDSKKANFDASHELEELLLEDNPLKAKQRKANQDNLSAEMRQMEEQFTSYDFKKMQRRSYYPHNQQLISTATVTSSGLASSRPATPATDLRPDNEIAIVNGSMELQGTDAGEMTKEVIEKEYR
ncbi:kinase-like domain-containing protein [Lentinula detonsa]|uniref:Kinase-like domain-containing protein n=2 Tax=Lentinula TaxID=5352 RepID=A0A9W8P2E9_9AGAR|nr:kinase-like domain-containing protein [Lentinula detonsa]KAJ3786504.1 kinase-like domain-containing protein [Lentinula aff. detonsa]KAJ3798334.1 kinase-like domain-containing protein [Lentinula aff. detonsa]KAJ3985948.1 kinase-like domain-containing protein [Lentinula detonsa]